MRAKHIQEQVDSRMHTIVYISQSCIAEAGIDQAIDHLTTHAQTQNRAFGITGMLLVRGNIFFQVLEGPTDSVRGLFSKIQVDARHTNVVTLLDEPIAQRSFDDWALRAFTKPGAHQSMDIAIHDIGKSVQRSGTYNPFILANHIKGLSQDMEELSVPNLQMAAMPIF